MINLSSSHLSARAPMALALVSVAFCAASFDPTLSPRTAQAATAGFDAAAIERSKQATLGVLQSGEDLTSPPSKTHFTMRGTAVHLGDGYLVTARHVVERDEEGRKVVPKEVTIMTSRMEEASAQLVGGSAFLDVVLYRLPADLAARLAATSFADSEAPPGQEVYTIGYPMGWGPAMMYGRVGNPNTFLPTADTRLVQLDLGACAGNSGGGVFDDTGRLIGLMHAIIQTDTPQAGDQRCSRFGFAIPGTLARKLVTAIMQGEQPSFSRLGIGLAAVRVGSNWRLSASDVGGPAKEAGLKKGDVLLAIDDTDILDGAQLKNYLIERTTPGQKVALKVLRGQQEQTLTVTLGKS
ncbi:MAG: S1C family serine protease [Nitrospiraceae bacterium]